MKVRPLPPLKELKESLDYNPDTGIFVWKKARQSIILGQVSGSKYINGYIYITFKQIRYLAHRLSYYMYHGVDPLKKLVDHIDGDKINNKINNLRLATESQNATNRINLNSNNTSGTTGVSKVSSSCIIGEQWRARISVVGVQEHLGLFTSKEDAIKARREAEIKYYGDFRGKE